jgi:hypothetical protein
MVDYVPHQLSSQDLAYITRCYNKCQKCDKKFNEFTCNDCDLHPAMMVYRSLPVLVKGRMKEKSAFMDTLEKQEENYQKQNKVVFIFVHDCNRHRVRCWRYNFNGLAEI